MPVHVLSDEDWGLIRKIVEKFRKETVIPSYGIWRVLDDDELWLTLVSKICSIGFPATIDKSRGKLSLHVLREVYSRGGIYALTTHIARVLRENNVKFYAKLSEYIAQNLLNRNIVYLDEERFVLLDRINIHLDRECLLCSQDFDSRFREVEARRFISLSRFGKIRGMGLVSASDFLISVGFVKTLVVLDYIHLGFLRILPSLRGVEMPARLSREEQYLSLEEIYRDSVDKAGIYPSELDRIIRQNIGEIMRIL